MAKKGEYTRAEALAEMKRLGFPDPVSVEEMAVDAGKWGVLFYEEASQAENPFQEKMLEAFTLLSQGDLEGFNVAMAESDSIEDKDDELMRAVPEVEEEENELFLAQTGPLYRLFDAAFGDDSSIAIMFYKSLADTWLSENAEEIEEDLYEYARTVGIKHTIPSTIPNDVWFTPQGMSYLKQMAEVRKRLLIEFSTFADTLGYVWRLRDRKKLPAWIAIITYAPELADQLLNDDYIRVQTSPIAAHMSSFMLLPLESYSDTKETTQNGKTQRISMQSSVEVRNAEEMAQNIFNGILKRKGSQSTHLLKLHLDLSNQAARKGGENPVIWYDIHEAAARMGYSKIPGRDSYDQKTLREIYERIKALESFHIAIGKVGTGKSAIHFVAPYWQRGVLGIEEKDIPLEEDGTLRDAGEVLQSKKAPVPRVIQIQPGQWWAELNHTQFLSIPAEVLKLPIDGRGNERNRMAVEICATLAVWERAGASYSPSQTKTVGAILESANITTLEELKADKNADRVRENFLAAMETVRKVGGFDVEYMDAGAGATGRGWHLRFWESRIRLTARPIDGVNMNRKSRRKGIRSVHEQTH